MPPSGALRTMTGPESTGAVFATHLPVWQIWFAGQTAPVHALMHRPFWQTSPAPHVTVAQSVGTHWPASAPVVSHVWVDVHAAHGHVGTHEPFSQTCPVPQLSPAHGSTQLPRRQTWPIGHTTPLHASTHKPF